MMPADQVECRSDHAYLGYPVAFHWQGHRLEVARIISEVSSSCRLFIQGA